MSKSGSVWSESVSWNALKSALPLALPLVVAGLALGAIIGGYNPLVAALVSGMVLFTLLVLWRKDEATLALVIIVHLYIDWYWGLWIGAQVIELVLLFIYYFAHSERFPWVMPPLLWMWLALILLAILPALHGISLFDTLNYYFNIFLGSLTIYWLGNLVARDTRNVRRVFQFLAIIGTLVAIHTVIQAATGKFLFATTRYDAYFASISSYELSISTIHRIGSFLINPDSNGGFLGIMLFLPLCLFIETKSLGWKICYLTQAFLIVVALLLTYSTGGWLAAGVGALGFIIFACPPRYRLIIPLIIIIICIALVLVFPEQMNLQVQHAFAPNEASLRAGAWQTGLNVMFANSWIGIGLGRYVYFSRADPYRVLAQYIPLAHPHNSFIEIGALAGIPLMLLFLALLACTFWLALLNWKRADCHTRILLGGGMSLIMAMSANSMVANEWTLIPIAAIGWLVMGVISSPLLTSYQLKSQKGLPAEKSHMSFLIGEGVHVESR
ncbi:MAG: O-antigen ligase family protein [Ktedonobacteraceae bacterium]